MAIPEDLLNALMKDYKNPEYLIGETGPTQTTDQAAAGAGDAGRDD